VGEKITCKTDVWMSDNVIRHLPEWMAVNGGMRYHFSALRVTSCVVSTYASFKSTVFFFPILLIKITAKGSLPLVHSQMVTAISLVFFKFFICYGVSQASNLIRYNT
jgi:hypothetical protein